MDKEELAIEYLQAISEKKPEVFNGICDAADPNNEDPDLILCYVMDTFTEAQLELKMKELENAE